MSSDFFSSKVFAVVGVSSKPDKVGYQIYKHLKDLGKNVYAIHPAMTEVDGDPVYKTLSDVPVPIEVVDIVVNPQVTEKVVEECHQLGIKKVWIQPGAESEKAVQFCKDHDMEVIYNACIMVPNKKF